MRALILGHALDPTANAAAAALHQRGGWQVIRHDIAGLAGARWHQRLAADGVITTRIETADGDIGACDVVLNRLGSAQALAFPGWSPVDRAYGQAEWLALLLSWLIALGGRVIGAPAGSELCGPANRPWLWMAAAARAGLVVHPGGATTSIRQFPPPRGSAERPELLAAAASAGPGDRATGHAAAVVAQCELLLVGDAVFGGVDPGPAVRAAALALAAAQRTPLLALTLAQAVDDPQWRFVAADAAPVVAEGAPLAALADLLQARAA